MSAVATATKAYTMPAVTVGQNVLHFMSEDEYARYTAVPPDRTVLPSVGVVTAVGNKAVTAWVFSAKDALPVRLTGLKHITDPNVSQFDTDVNGFWAHTQEHTAFAELQAKVQAMQTQSSQRR